MRIFGLHKKACIHHAERIEQALLQKLAEAHSRQAFDHIALNVDRNTVNPLRAGLIAKGNVF